MTGAALLWLLCGVARGAGMQTAGTCRKGLCRLLCVGIGRSFP